jgi:hypothetical protein
MKAQDGVMFLSALLQSPESEMTTADLEEAVRLAGQYSPSAVFNRAAQYWQSVHGERGFYYLGFAKGTRWLAMIRRDEGQLAFEQAAERIRGRR